MATEFRLNYTGSEINQKLGVIDGTKTYYTSEEIDEMVNNLPDGFVQPDFAQTDSTQSDYIKNKPIYNITINQSTGKIEQPIEDIVAAAQESKILFCIGALAIFTDLDSASGTYNWIRLTLLVPPNMVMPIKIYADGTPEMEKSDNMQMKSDRVTSISEESTDEQYPSAKAVYDALQNIEVVSEWNDIQNKPGDTVITSVDVSYDWSSYDNIDNQDNYRALMYMGCNVSTPRTINVSLKNKTTEDIADFGSCELSSVDLGSMELIQCSINTTTSTDGLMMGTETSLTKIDSSLPAVAIAFVPAQSMTMFATDIIDYTNYELIISCEDTTSIKLSNSSLNLDEEPIEGSENYVNSGAVYTAFRDVYDFVNEQVGGSVVNSVNGKTGDVVLTAFDVGALPNTTEIPVIPTNISTFKNDMNYMTKNNVEDRLFELSKYYIKEDELERELNEKQDKLIFDNVPKETSSNPITSLGVYNALKNISVGGGVSEWEDIKNKPFYEEGLKIEWDGTPTEEYIDCTSTLDVMVYKVGEPITKEDLIGSTATITDDGEEMSVVVPESMFVDMSETGFLVMDTNSGEVFAAVTFDTDVFDLSMFAPGLTLEIPSGGLWILANDGGSRYVSSIMGADYTVKQIDPKFIPANLDFDLSDYYTKVEVDGTLTADYYTKSEITDTLEDYYTKIDIDNLMGDVNAVLNEISEMIGE